MSISDLIKKEPLCGTINSETKVPKHRVMLLLDREILYSCCDSRNCEYKILNKEVHRHECLYVRVQYEHKLDKEEKR